MVLSLTQTAKRLPNSSQKFSQLLVSLIALTAFLGTSDAYCGIEDEFTPAFTPLKNMALKEAKEAAGLLGLPPFEILELILAKMDINGLSKIDGMCQYLHLYTQGPLADQIVAHLKLAQELAPTDDALFERLRKTPQANLQDIHAITSYFADKKSEAVNTLLAASEQQLKITVSAAPLLFGDTLSIDRLRALLESENKTHVNSSVLFNRAVQYEKKKEHHKAVKLYEIAAAQGYADAQRNLGMMYAVGDSVEQDDYKAVAFWEKAAAQRHASAQYNLGVMYAKGHGIPQDDHKAVKFYKKAAAQGHVGAQFSLGVMYVKGRGVEQNDYKAVEFLEKAAAQGFSWAQFSLGTMYSEGRGVKQDDQKALELYRLAAGQGLVKAILMIEHKGMSK